MFATEITLSRCWVVIAWDICQRALVEKIWISSSVLCRSFWGASFGEMISSSLLFCRVEGSLSNVIRSSIDVVRTCSMSVGFLLSTFCNRRFLCSRNCFLCPPGSSRDMCPLRENNPNEMGRLGLSKPSLLWHSLSRSGSKPQACKHDMNSCAVSIVRSIDFIWMLFGLNLSDFIEVRDGEGFMLCFGDDCGEYCVVSTLFWILCPTFSALSFTLAINPKKIKSRHFWKENKTAITKN